MQLTVQSGEGHNYVQVKIELTDIADRFMSMNKAATLSAQDAQHKAQAEHYLAESQRILRELAAERRRAGRRRTSPPSIVAQVKAILQGA